MANELVNIGTTAIQEAGDGLDFSSKMFRLKPVTITLNQPMTQADGAIPGKLRINETGEQYDKMRVVLIATPSERCNYYEGVGDMIKRSENLMCFSNDMVQPNNNARNPQAMACSACPKNPDLNANWSKWRDNGKNKSDIPGAEITLKVLLIDTQYQMPMYFYATRKSKKAFEAAMENIARLFMKLKAEGKKPNIYDIGFDLSSVRDTVNKQNFNLKIDGFKLVTPEEQVKFGALFQQFKNRDNGTEAQVEAKNVAAQQAEIDAVINDTIEI
jgi:hypothetical protein